MKKILIVSHAMEIGGAERALLGFLENIDTTKYKVDLFLMKHSGELMKYIPPNINLLPENKNYASLAIPILDVLRKGKIRIACARLRGKYSAKKRVKKLGISGENDVALQYSHMFTISVMPKISDVKYDLAISFLTPHYFVTEKVEAKKKVAWIHTDYATVAIDQESQMKMWSNYDVIASISNDVTKSFLMAFPKLQSKVVLITNMMPIKYIKNLSEKEFAEKEMSSNGAIKLLSIGRFCPQKNFDNIPDICKKIRNRGIDVKWYIIGYGGDEKLIKQRILEAEMQKHVIILGKKENPYPYIRTCDLYVQPSRYEGKSVSVIEAQMLHKPVVITNYSTAQSQLEDGVDGVIVPMDNAGCALGIAKVIKNKELQNKLIENTKKIDYANSNEIVKIYKVME